MLLDSCVTGRMVAPLKNGELVDDLGERGVKGLALSELWAPGVSGDEFFAFACRVKELRSRLGTADCLEGILRRASVRGAIHLKGYRKNTPGREK